MATLLFNILKVWIEFKKITNAKSKNEKFHDIRNQLLWGNANIKNKLNKTLIFRKWIDSGLLFIDNIISNSGSICETKVLQKLKDKSDWIREINVVKSSISNTWKRILKSDISLKTKVNIKLTLPHQKFLKLTNNDVYSIFQKSYFEKPYIHKYWNDTLKTQINWADIYCFIHENCANNWIKQFIYKLIHNIIATKDNLKKWKISANVICSVYGDTENIEHFLIQCNSIAHLWQHIFSSIGYDNVVCLKSLVTGYKP